MNFKNRTSPKISIVTPNYNMGNFLELTIKSVIDQNYPNLEYIIIDGGSTDNSIEIIKKYENMIHYWISEPDRGLYDALQKGFDKCTGEIMAWINSDDLYHPNAFSTIAEIFKKYKKVEWVTGAMTHIDEYGRTVFIEPPRSWTKFNYMLGDFKWIQQESTFWRRTLLCKSEFRFSENLRFAGDLALWLKFFQFAELYSVHALIGGFRLRKNNQLSLENFDQYMFESNEIIRIENKKLKGKDLLILKILIFNETFIKKIPIVGRYLGNRIFNRFTKLPNKIVFDRYIQEFALIQK